MNEQHNKLYGSEEANTASLNSHALPVMGILRAINDEDARVADAVAQAIPQIDILIKQCVAKMKQGGRLFYIGAGTSGRLGVLDASECPPTYGVGDDMVQGIMAGGDAALRLAGEGIEDDASAGVAAVAELTAKDTLVGISASGSAAYVQAALQDAQARGIFTAAICTTPDAPLLDMAECKILAPVGAEFVAGSTRMKSGTAQKMILNMISTTVMIQLGKVYAGRMIDVKTSNTKLIQRAEKMLVTLTGCDEAQAKKLIADVSEKTSSPVKPAVIMALEHVSYTDALKILDEQNGRIDAIMRKHGRDRALGCD